MQKSTMSSCLANKEKLAPCLGKTGSVCEKKTVSVFGKNRLRFWDKLAPFSGKTWFGLWEKLAWFLGKIGLVFGKNWLRVWEKQAPFWGKTGSV